MSGPQFFQTIMGRKFYDRDVPQITKALQGIHEELKRANDLKEQEMYDSKNQDRMEG